MTLPAFITGVGGSYGYASLLERHRLTVERYHLGLGLGERGPAALRAVSLTDLHFDPLYEEDFLAELVRRVNDLQPDVVLLTGDYISRTSKRVDDLSAILGGLEAKAGVFACLGNHDVWDRSRRVEPSLVRCGIHVLVNAHTRVPCNDGELIIAGLQSVWGGLPDWAGASRGIKADERALLLMHEPDYAERVCQDGRIALQCSGHTHGGQVRLPGMGALILPRWGRLYQAGFYDVGTLKLHVNRGIGTVGQHVRFLCPPEIACFDIVNNDVKGS